MLDPFVTLLADLIHLYMLCVIAWAILATLISFKIVNGFQPVVQKIMFALNRLVEPALKPIRKLIPNLGGLDISPVLLLILLNFALNVLYRYFYHWG